MPLMPGSVCGVTAPFFMWKSSVEPIQKLPSWSLVDGSEIGVVGVGKRDDADFGAGEAHHSRLCADPEILLVVFKEVQNRVAGQRSGRGDLRELAVRR